MITLIFQASKTKREDIMANNKFPEFADIASHAKNQIETAENSFL
jgi:hypothetical protein